MGYISLSKKADKELVLGRQNEAEKLLERGLSLAKKKGNIPFIEFFMSELESLKSNYSLAIPHYERAVKKAKSIEDRAFFLKNLGVTYSFLEMEEEAIECYERALAIKPDDYDSLRQKGVSLSELGLEKEAIECYEKALAIKPDDYRALRSKGISLSKQGQEDEAIKCYEKALAIKPDDFSSLRQKGVSLSKLSLREEAIECYEKALAIKPDDWYSLVSKAITLEKGGLKKEAERTYGVLEDNIEAITDKEIIDLVIFRHSIKRLMFLKAYKPVNLIRTIFS